MASSTQVKLTSTSIDSIRADALVVPVFKGELRGAKRQSSVAVVKKALGRFLLEAAKQEGFDGKRGQRLTIHAHDKMKSTKVILLGVGGKENEALAVFREGVGNAARMTRTTGGARLAVAAPEIKGESPSKIVGDTAEAALLGGYQFDRYISESPDRPKRSALKTVTIATGKVTAAHRREATMAEAVAEATCLARDLVNEPPGAMTPKDLSKAARSLARTHGLKCTVGGAREIERLKMGLFQGVSLGADTEPQLITLEYKPAGKPKGKGIAIVGKGITFDSGGYDLKPHQAMDSMKMDMAGAAAAIGVMRAVAAIKPPFPVTCYVGACENLVSGRAYKPGDVLKSRKGLTVEVINTDAEGRLVLADLLTYASEKDHEVILDVATLTGACLIALGPFTFGAFSKDDEVTEELLSASKKAGEDAWRLPLNQLLREHLRSNIADLKNSGGRAGGAISAALFLSAFVGETPWVHIDIAGPAMYAANKGVVPKGASGAPVRTLARFIRERAGT